MRSCGRARLEGWGVRLLDLSPGDGGGLSVDDEAARLLSVLEN
jgi:hypothetical protein